MFFGKYFVFTKTEKFQKQCCPVLTTQSRVIQVACYSRELACWFWQLVCEWKVQSRGVHRDFCGSARDSLVGRPSSHEKHLNIFFTILSLSALATCPSDLLATHPSREKRVFCISKTVFKTFSIFPSNFCDCSLSSSFLSQLNLTQTLRVTHLNLHFCIIPSPIFKKKGVGFLYLTRFLHVLRIIFFLLGCHCELRNTVWTCFCLDCWVFVYLVSSLCVFKWLYTDILYIMTTLGHY